MVHTCFLCKWRSTKEPQRSFHQFPLEEDERMIWLKTIGKENTAIGRRTALCCLHFEESCFRYGFVCGRKILKKGSLPTLHLTKSSADNQNCTAINKSNSTDTYIAPTPPKETETECTREPLKVVETIIVEVESTDETRRPAIHIENGTRGKNHSISKIMDDTSINSTHIQYWKTRLRDKNREIAILNRKIQQYKQNKIKLTKKAVDFKKQMIQLEKKVKPVEAKFGPVMQYILQVARCKRKKINEYPMEIKAFASTISFFSPKAYKYLQTVIPNLPNAATIRRWLSEIKILPGVCKTSLEIINNKVTEAMKLDKRVLCNVVIDDMAFRKPKTNKKLLTMTARKVMVIMVVCINDSWKIPIAHYATEGLTGKNRADFLMQCLKDLHSTGVIVTSLTFDCGAQNVVMANHLGVDIIDTANCTKSFVNPVTNEPVYIVIDACHSVKLIRNTLASKSILFDGDGNTIEWKFLKLLVTYQFKYNLQAVTKIRKHHVNFAAQKTKGNLALQVLSESVSQALNYLRTQIHVAEFSGALGTEHFCKNINDIFDLLNSKQPVKDKDVKRAPIHQNNLVDVHDKITEYELYIKSLFDKQNESVVTGNRKLGFIGLLISMRSSISIFEKYAPVEAMNLKHFLTHRLSQDHLELPFLITRHHGRPRNLTLEEFQSTFKRLLVFAQVGAS